METRELIKILESCQISVPLFDRKGNVMSWKNANYLSGVIIEKLEASPGMTHFLEKIENWLYGQMGQVGVKNGRSNNKKANTDD